jgi:hypothetical protein
MRQSRGRPALLWSITELLIVASTYNDNLFLGMQDLRYSRPWLGTIPFSRMLHHVVVWYKSTENSEEYLTSVFRVESFYLKVGENLFLSTSLPIYKITRHRISLFFRGGGGSTVLRRLYQNSSSMSQNTIVLLFLDSSAVQTGSIKVFFQDFF